MIFGVIPGLIIYMGPINATVSTPEYPFFINLATFGAPGSWTRKVSSTITKNWSFQPVKSSRERHYLADHVGLIKKIYSNIEIVFLHPGIMFNAPWSVQRIISWKDLGYIFSSTAASPDVLHGEIIGIYETGWHHRCPLAVFEKTHKRHPVDHIGPPGRSNVGDHHGVRPIFLERS